MPHSTVIEIDGSHGEGGGQIIRTSLALSIITGKPFKVTKVRAGRTKPGLQPQHLASVNAAADISGAKVTDAAVSSTQFEFAPEGIFPGNYHFRIGTAGSTMLVLQTILPPLMTADGPSRVIIEGGTHNTHAPPFDFVKNTFLPVLHKMGANISVQLNKYGFFPPGGGQVQVSISPAEKLRPLVMEHRGNLTKKTIRILLVKLPNNIAQREISVLRTKVPELKNALDEVDVSDNAISPGNVAFVELVSEHLVETFSSIGERNKSAEAVAEQAAEEVLRYLSVNAAVGEHLADQLLIPLALAGGGSFLTGKPTLHTETNIEIIQKFLPVRFKTETLERNLFRISVET